MIRSIIILMFIGISGFSFGQTWQTLNWSQFNSFFGFIGGNNSQTSARYFKINQYDNSLWMAYNDKVQRLGNDGSYQYFDYTNTPVFDPLCRMYEFEFTPNYTFLVEGNFYGLYKFNGNQWTQEVPLTNGVYICADKDSVWVARTNQNYIYWRDGFNGQGTFSSFRRIARKNGHFWGSSGQDDVVMKLDSNDSYTFFTPDNNPLMDYSNYDFKFSPYTDTLYVAGDQGLSLATDEIFIDSINSASSTDMPSDAITEFEFDPQNNIWAVFGTDFFNPTSIAHYNQQTKVWSDFYDTNNSPIDFSGKITIEVDTSGNLWVADGPNLHVLKINNAPAWLSIVEQQNQYFKIYPNPSENGEINFDSNTQATTIIVFDLLGNEILNTTFKNSLKLNVGSGVYFIQTWDGERIISTQKWINK